MSKYTHMNTNKMAINMKKKNMHIKNLEARISNLIKESAYKDIMIANLTEQLNAVPDDARFITYAKHMEIMRSKNRKINSQRTAIKRKNMFIKNLREKNRRLKTQLDTEGQTSAKAYVELENRFYNLEEDYNSMLSRLQNVEYERTQLRDTLANEHMNMQKELKVVYSMLDEERAWSTTLNNALEEIDDQRRNAENIATELLDKQIYENQKEARMVADMLEMTAEELDEFMNSPDSDQHH